MKHSQTLQNMFEPYDIDVIRLFCDSFLIDLFIDTNFPYSKYFIVLGINDRLYQLTDPKTFYFHLPENKLCGGKGYALVVLKHSEEEIINKFHKFLKLKAFL